jgi:hypothetical protein
MPNDVSAAGVIFAIDQLRRCQFGESPVRNNRIEVDKCPKARFPDIALLI